MLGALLTLFGLGTLWHALPDPRPALVQLEQTLDTPLTQTEVELTLFTPGPDERPVEHPVFAELALPEDAAGRFERIVVELRAQTLDSVWPTTLPAPVAFAVETDNGAKSVAVLDFAVDTPLAVDVETERLLLQSIQATLLRNGADRVQILVNHEETGSFLGHVALASVLEE